MKNSISEPRVTASSDTSRIASELVSRQTGMSLQRTQLSADRTLMSSIRTSLSLMGFGFIIDQLFSRLRAADVLTSGDHAARNFGAALVTLGIAVLVLGIGSHVRFILGLRGLCDELTADGLIHAQRSYPISATLIAAVLLLLVGVVAIVSIVFSVGPFG
jgi:putative membrane protein